MYMTDKQICISSYEYENLTVAIIIQAVKDYRRALEMSERGRKSECVRFFRSDWFKVLTTMDSEFLIRKLKEEVQRL